MKFFSYRVKINDQSTGLIKLTVADIMKDLNIQYKEEKFNRLFVVFQIIGIPIAILIFLVVGLILTAP